MSAVKDSSLKLRLGVIGTGLRGQWMTHLCMLRGDVDIRAICDIDHEMINTTLNIIKNQEINLRISIRKMSMIFKPCKPK